MFKNVAFGRNQRSREYRLPSCKIGHKDVPSPIVPPFPRSAFLHFTGYSHISLLLKVRREQSFTVLGLQLHGERTMSPEKRFSSCVRCPTVREGEQQCNSVTWSHSSCPGCLSWLWSLECCCVCCSGSSSPYPCSWMFLRSVGFFFFCTTLWLALVLLSLRDQWFWSNWGLKLLHQWGVGGSHVLMSFVPSPWYNLQIRSEPWSLADWTKMNFHWLMSLLDLSLLTPRPPQN